MGNDLACDADKVKVLLLISRKKDGSVKDISHKRIWSSLGEKIRAEKELIAIAKDDAQHVYRLYETVNYRSLRKAWFNLNRRVVELQEQDVDGTFLWLRNYHNMWISELMKPESRASRGSFLIDIDTKDKGAFDSVMLIMEKHSVECERFYTTPSGFHFIVSPFNPKIFDEVGFPVDIKKDGLTFLQKIDQNSE